MPPTFLLAAALYLYCLSCPPVVLVCLALQGSRSLRIPSRCFAAAYLVSGLASAVAALLCLCVFLAIQALAMRFFPGILGFGTLSLAAFCFLATVGIAAVAGWSWAWNVVVQRHLNAGAA